MDSTCMATAAKPSWYVGTTCVLEAGAALTFGAGAAACIAPELVGGVIMARCGGVPMVRKPDGEKSVML